MRISEVEISKVPISDLKPYDNNAKLHTREQIDAVEASIKEFGFRNPVIAWHNDDGVAEIVAGHARTTAAKNLGMEEVPCIFVDDLSDAQRRALTLADNQTTMMTGFDEDMLAYELDVLADEFDMADFGFDDGIDEDAFGTDFDLPDEDKPNVSKATFILAPEQRDFIMQSIARADTSETETFGNVNRNGNALYEVVTEWLQQRTSNCE